MSKPPALMLVASLRDRRWSVEEARTVLAEMDRSGLSCAAFALREGLDVQRLYFWRRRLVADADSVESRPTFVELRPAPLTPERLEVVLRSGRVVRVPESFDEATLRRLIEVLE